VKASKDRCAQIPRKSKRSLEANVLRKRLFHLLIAISLAVTLALTIREAIATALITSRGDAVTRCTDLPSRHSIHTEVRDGVSVLYSENGPTGVDGGLPELLTAYRTCSRSGE
jgi:hypothetical protein